LAVDFVAAFAGVAGGDDDGGTGAVVSHLLVRQKVDRAVGRRETLIA
jgi:hypothetical protein